jgi:hypothetical protein
MAKYKDATTLKKSRPEELTDIERAEFRMFANIEVDGLMARLSNTSQDFKLQIVDQLYNRIIGVNS